MSVEPVVAGGLERIEIPVGGFIFDAWAAGPADGVPVLLLHGFPQTGWSYRHQLGALGAAGFRAVAPDQRGYSPRARPDGVENYSTANLVADVISMADQLGFERFHLVGHDWGAAVAWTTAGLHPDRILSLTALSVPHPFAFGRAIAGEAGPGGEPNDQAERSGYMQMFVSPEAEDVFLANDAEGLKAMYSMSGLADADAEFYVAVMRDRATLTGALNWYRAALAGTAVDPEAVAKLATITVPTLFVWSTNDPAISKIGADLTSEYVTGPYQFEILEGVSHWIAEEAPEQLTSLMLGHLQTHR